MRLISLHLLELLENYFKLSLVDAGIGHLETTSTLIVLADAQY